MVLGLLQWGHGDEAVEEERSVSGMAFLSCCFNGATAMKPWKSARDRRQSSRQRALQWGHGDEAVEETQLLGGLDQSLNASMGPRR